MFTELRKGTRTMDTSFILALSVLVIATEASIDDGTNEAKPPSLSRGIANGVAYANFVANKFQYLNISILGAAPVSKGSECGLACVHTLPCFSFNLAAFSDINGRLLCELLPSDKFNSSEKLVASQIFHHYSMWSECSSEPCQNNGTCVSEYEQNTYTCVCAANYTGKNCELFNAGYIAVFTNLNASGRLGPTSVGSHYRGQDHDGQVTVSNGTQQWTVPYTGDYKIEAVGAAGGMGRWTTSPKYRGRGARISGTFHLSKGEMIHILIGQEGGNNRRRASSGGRGGTFVVRGSRTPLIVAGGGGGILILRSRHAGCDASTNTTGNVGYKSWPGGANGQGAQTADSGASGGGGGGFYSSGRSSKKFGGTKGTGGEGGKGFLQGGVGGRPGVLNASGGFGGGGGPQGRGGGAGGGGGYSGGGSGENKEGSCGGGGGSYNAGINQQNECCYKTSGHGQVTITRM